MPRTMPGVLSAAKRRKIAELGGNENATLVINPIPDTVTFEQRIASGLRANGDFQEIFSIYVSPEQESIVYAKSRWQQAKDEMENLFAVAHAAAEERKRLRLVRARMREERLAMILAGIVLRAVPIYLDGMGDVVKVTGLFDEAGNKQSAIIALSKGNRSWNRSNPWTAGVTTITQHPVYGDVVRVQGEAANGPSRDVALNTYLSACKANMANGLLNKEESAARSSGTPLPWMEPSV